MGELNQQLLTAKQELDELKQSHQQQTKESQKKDYNIQTLQERMKNLNTTNEKLNKEFSEQKSQLEQALHQLTELKKENATLKIQIKPEIISSRIALNEDATPWSSSVTSPTEKSKEGSTSHATQSLVLTKSEHHNTLLEELTTKNQLVEALTKDKEELDNLVKQLTKEKEEIMERNQAQQVILDKPQPTQVEQELMQAVLNNNDELGSQLKQVSERVSALKDKDTASKTYIQKLELENQNLKDQVLGHQMSSTDQQQKLEHQEATINALETKLNAAQVHTASPNGLTSLQEDIMTVNEGLEKVNVKQEAKIKELEKQQKELLKQVEDTRKLVFGTWCIASANPTWINQPIDNKLLRQYFVAIDLVAPFTIKEIINFQTFLRNQIHTALDYPFEGEETETLSVEQRNAFVDYLSRECVITRYGLANTFYDISRGKNISKSFKMCLNILEGKESLLSD